MAGLLYPEDNVQKLCVYPHQIYRRQHNLTQDSDLVHASSLPPLFGKIKLCNFQGKFRYYLSFISNKKKKRKKKEKEKKDSTKNWGKDGLSKRETSCFIVVGFSKEKPTNAKQFLVDVII